jgi:hypothetical protein
MMPALPAFTLFSVQKDVKLPAYRFPEFHFTDNMMIFNANISKQKEEPWG